ncbi:MAG TPA: SCO family protein [Burkholderiaceae bacterium]|nr:SCO family protein [Burkholderiaceae bacterium]
MLRRSFLAAAVLLAACKPAQFSNIDITGAPYAQNFVLTDHTGQARTLADYRGKVVVMFFGFTQCPDVCPTTLADLAEVKRRLGDDGARLQVLFVSLDPQRDTPAVLSQYVANFDPSFVGLTGTPQTIAHTAKDFKVFYQKVPGKTENSYTIDHSTGSYVFDREGKVRLILRHGQGADAIVGDLKRLL